MTELELLDRIINGDKSAFQELKDLYWPVTLVAIAAYSADAEVISNICVDAWQLIHFALKKRSTTSNRAIELASKGSFDRFVKEAAKESLAIHQLKGELGEDQVNKGLTRLKEKYDTFIKYYLRSKGVDLFEIEDIASIVWEKVWEGRHQYSFSKGSFFVWLFTITHNEYVNWRRSIDPRVEIEIPISLTEEQQKDLEREIGRDLAEGQVVHVSIELSDPTKLEMQKAVLALVNRLGRGISTRSQPQMKGNKAVVDLVFDEISTPRIVFVSAEDNPGKAVLVYDQALKQLFRNEINVFVPRRLVFAFVHLLSYEPRRVEKELMDILLSNLAKLFEEQYTEQMCSGEIPECRNYPAYFASLREEMGFRVSEAVNDSDYDSAERLKGIIHSPVGETTFRHYCSLHPSKTFSSWIYDVKRKLRRCVVTNTRR